MLTRFYFYASSYPYFCNKVLFCFCSIIYSNHLRHVTNRARHFRSEITNKVNYTHNQATILSVIVLIVSLIYAQWDTYTTFKIRRTIILRKRFKVDDHQWYTVSENEPCLCEIDACPPPLCLLLPLYQTYLWCLSPIFVLAFFGFFSRPFLAYFLL